MAIVLSVLRFMTSDHPFDIFKPFSQGQQYSTALYCVGEHKQNKKSNNLDKLLGHISAVNNI